MSRSLGGGGTADNSGCVKLPHFPKKFREVGPTHGNLALKRQQLRLVRFHEMKDGWKNNDVTNTDNYEKFVVFY